MRYFYFTALTLITILASCSRNDTVNNIELVQVQIVDQNNQTETVSSEERIQKYKSTDFLSPQPYQKVVRYFSRNAEGHVPQQLTSYYPNGQIKQYLEAIDLRASGVYREWHENGNLKVDTTVIGGKADFSATSQKEWLFAGISKVYDEKKNLIAEILYQKGKLEGESKYYYADGTLRSIIPYEKDLIHGFSLEYYQDGTLKKKLHHLLGKLDGVQLIYWKSGDPLAIENYMSSKLDNGVYYRQNGKIVSEVSDGNGTRFVSINDKEYQLAKYVNGIQQGPIHIYTHSGTLKGVLHTKGNKKHGREIAYYKNKDTPLDDLGAVMRYCIDWVEDKIHGNIKTWYSNGVMESQRQFANNKKNGPSVYWYKDSTLMSVEEYENDKLVNGKYFKKNNTDFVSEVKAGNGIVTLYDEEGVLIEKITYQNGVPVVL